MISCNKIWIRIIYLLSSRKVWLGLVACFIIPKDQWYDRLDPWSEARLCNISIVIWTMNALAGLYIYKHRYIENVHIHKHLDKRDPRTLSEVTSILHTSRYLCTYMSFIHSRMCYTCLTYAVNKHRYNSCVLYIIHVYFL